MTDTNDAARFNEGMATRRAVLGDTYVDRALGNVTGLDADFQRWITEFAWGGVWSRPGMDRRTRSLITVAILAALGRENELRLHLRASQNNGVTEAELTEMLFHVAVYAGVPAANHAIAVAKSIFSAPEARSDSR
jgi:4-carboxymuconolactone decarboxylase